MKRLAGLACGLGALLGALSGATEAAAEAAAPAFAQEWRLDGLESPESALLSRDGRFLYVSNVGGEGDAKDGNGFISRVSLDGELLERRWAAGMDAPKGLALKDGRLFAADITDLVEIDAATGRVVARRAAPGAKFLNDVAVAPDGRVLVADSGNASIYAFDGEGVATWLEGEPLRSVNGLLPQGERLIVTTMQGRLLSVDFGSKAIRVLAEGLGAADGVVALEGGGYLVGEWPGRLFQVKADGSSVVLMDTRAEQTYLNDFLLIGDRLIVPHWRPGALTAFRLSR